ncbi:hypothetical protein Q7P37_002313 [Cladosporium fusiforme]
MESTSPQSGYYELAEFMSSSPETAIFRRFGVLNLMNLLGLQAEVVELQRQWKNIYTVPEFRESLDDEEKDFSINFHKLLASEDSEHLKLLMNTRRVLQEYNAALLQVVQVQRLASPDGKSAKVLQEWLDEVNRGDGFLKGAEVFTWSLHSDRSKEEKRTFAKDLATTFTSNNEKDLFSELLSSMILKSWAFIHFLHRTSKHGSTSDAIDDEGREILEFSEEKLIRINNIVVSVISAVLPVAAIVALFFIKTEGGRIGAMAGFTFFFAVVLAVFTNARRLEIAASTAAFAAVEVVFIGSDLGKSRLEG